MGTLTAFLDAILLGAFMNASGRVPTHGLSFSLIVL